MKTVLHLLSFGVPLILVSANIHATSSVQGIGSIFFLLLAAEMCIGIDTDNGKENSNFTWYLTTWLWLPVQGTLTFWLLTLTTNPEMSPFKLFSLAFQVGIIAGSFGITIAHELMHRKNRVEAGMAEILMSLACYTHFCIQHVEGHHKNVGTPKDPATARFGEQFYAFYFRAVYGSFVSAWRIEVIRLTGLGLPVLNVRNRMLRYFVTIIVIYAGIGFMFGTLGVAVFAFQGFIAFSLLELLNYIQHYGLRRAEISPGCYERIGPSHSWNSSHRITNLFLFNLGRHSDHHYNASQRFYNLRHVEGAPQLPAGYFVMFALALLPHVWHSIMDPRVLEWQDESAAGSGQ